MNLTILNGRLCTIPKLSIIQIEDERICACKFVIGVTDFTDWQDVQNEDDIDFLECIAFDRSAKMINDNFMSGSKIVVRGKLKNVIFEDHNFTTHYTNVLLVELAESGDTRADSDSMLHKQTMDLSIISEQKRLEQCYRNIKKRGFLCIDEDHYYDIARRSLNLLDKR